MIRLLLGVTLCTVVILFVTRAQTPANLTAAHLRSAYDVLAHQDDAMNVLLGWGVASVGSGAVLVFQESRVLRDVGIQNVAWGLIDGVIALYVKRSLAEKRLSGFSPSDEIKSFRTALLINTLLDVAYIAAGSFLLATGKENLRGHGYGIVLQGSFLFLFDGINYLLTFRK